MTFHSFDADYIARLTRGDAAAEEDFASYFGELLYLKLRSRLRSWQLIEDIRQETLLRVLQILRKGGLQSPEKFGAFVNGVCNRVTMEMCRSDGRQEAIDPAAEEPRDTSVDLDAPLIQSDTKHQVHEVLLALPEKDRNILLAVYMEEADKSEICRRHHVDSTYLRVLVHRAKLRFRQIYTDKGRA